MSLKPDHTAADLRKLMDQFATTAEPASPAEQANRIRQQLTEMDYGGGRSPHAGMGLPRDDLDLNPAGRKEIIVKPETVKKTRRDVGDRLDQAFAQAYDDKDVKEGSAGWMLRQDPALAKKVRDNTQGYKDLKKMAGKPVPKKDEKGVAEGRVDQIAPGGADYSKHSTDELKAMLRPGVMGRNELRFKTLIRQELKKRENQGVAEGSREFNEIKTTPYKANQMLGGKDPVAFVIEVLCPDQSVVNMIQTKVGTAYQVERDDSIEGNGIGIEIISQRLEGGRTAQAAYKQILDIIKQSGGQFNDSTEVTIARQTQGVTEAEAKGPFTQVKTKTLQQFWDSHKDEQNPAPVLADKLKRIRQELVRRKRAGVTEGEEQQVEGRAGVDDVDTVGFSVNSEAAYNAVMQRFGDAIDLDETDGIMYAPARLWPRIEMIAFDADGEGATRDDGIAEVKHFKTSYGYAGGSKPSGGQYRHPEQAKADSAAKKTVQAQQKNKQLAVDEAAMSRAAKGNEKYGKTGMAALAQAGRAGASKATLDDLRDRYNRYKKDMAEGRADRNEMDTPAVQRAIADMKQRHEKEPFDLEKAQALGQKLAARNRDPQRK